MIASFVAHILHTPLDAIERWSPEKLMGYFQSANDLLKVMSGK